MISKLTSFWRNLIHKRQVERDLEREVESYLDLLVDNQIEAGVDPIEARRAALIEMGELERVKENVRRVRVGYHLEAFIQDLPSVVLLLIKKPAFIAIVVLTLSLGIGTCTSVFSVVEAALLRPLPFPGSDRLVELSEVNQWGNQVKVTEPNFHDLQERNRAFKAMAFYEGGSATILGGSRPVRANAYAVSEDFFKVLGSPPMLGQTLGATRANPDGKSEVVVSQEFWKRVLAAKKDFTNITLTVWDHDFTVIGVMPANFNFPEDADLWLPSAISFPNPSRNAHNWRAIARLQSDTNLEGALSDIANIGRQLKLRYGNQTDAETFAITPLRELQFKPIRKPLLILLGAVGLLLLIACCNAANILLDQMSPRQKTLAVRNTLGITRLRSVQQFITESLILTMLAGAFGWFASSWAVKLMAGLKYSGLPTADRIRVDARSLIFAIGLSMLIALALGILPFLVNARVDLRVRALSWRNRKAVNRRRLNLTEVLVISQMALTLMLLIGAGLLGRSLHLLLSIDPGFQTEGAMTMAVSLPLQRADVQGKNLFHFYQQLFARLASIPGIRAVGGISSLPMSNPSSNGTFAIDDDRGKSGNAEYRIVSSGYFRAMGIPVLSGRLFDETDIGEATHAAIISQSLAKTYLRNENPIGTRIQFANMDGYKQVLEVIGVVGDLRDSGPEAPVPAMVYVNYVQRPRRSADFSIIARSDLPSKELKTMLGHEVSELDPELPVSFVSLHEIYFSSLSRLRFSLGLFVFLSLTGLLLSTIGVYNVMSRSLGGGKTNAHSPEARSHNTVREITNKAIGLSVRGIALGLIGAVALTRSLSGILYGVSTTDPLTFVVVTLLLGGLVLVACYLPALRASRIKSLVDDGAGG